MARRSSPVIGALVAGAFSVFLAPVMHAADGVPVKRPFRMDDMLDIEQLEQLVLAPDGRAVAFERCRSRNSQVTNALLLPETRSDVWLQLDPAEPARNLTQGAADSTGWWEPRWSPDGSRLLFLSSRGDRVTPWVWERATDKIRQLSTTGVDPRGGSGQRCQWGGDRRVLCLAVGDGESDAARTNLGRAAIAAESAWAKAIKGEATADVVDSREFPRIRGRLILLDIDGGGERVVADVAVERRSATWWVSPKGDMVAFVSPMPNRYGHLEQLSLGRPATRVLLASLGTNAFSLKAPLPSNVLTTTVAWSPDGRHLAFFAFGDAPVHPDLAFGEARAKAVLGERPASKESPARLWRVSPYDGDVVEVPTRELDMGQAALPPAFQWTSSGEFLMRAKRLSDRARIRGARASWLVLARDGTLRALTSAAFDPEALEAMDHGEAFVGVYSDDVWRVDPTSGKVTNLTERFDAPILDAIPYPRESRRRVLVLRAGKAASPKDEETIRYRFNRPIDGVQTYLLADGGGPTPLKPPVPSAVIQDVTDDAKGRTVWYGVDDITGSSYWRCSEAHGCSQVVSTNTFRAEIAVPEERMIEYLTLNGEPAQAKLTLPANYVPGRRYPLVVDSDIGYTPKNAPTRFKIGDKNETPEAYPTAKLYSSAGYMYVFTSLPTTGMDDAGRTNLLLLTNGLLPAVDKLVQLGLVDSERVFLYGASSFGFGVFGTITQTTRFKAAVAVDGWVDNVNVALAVPPELRYRSNAFEYSSSPVPTSGDRTPVWRDVERLRRNSPLTYVERVRTPLMIMHGEFDFLPMSDVEMFFSALVQQGTPAAFVRYWGEGHGATAPANHRDAFARVLAWYEQYGDIARDETGQMVFDGDRVKSRAGAPPLSPSSYARFEPLARRPTARSANAAKAAFDQRP